MVNLFCTADKVDDLSDGGIVTNNEYEALKETGPVTLVDGKIIKTNEGPFMSDYYAEQIVNTALKRDRIKHAHFYSGTFSKTVRLLKTKGVLVTYTVAASDLQESKKEYNSQKLKFDYPYISDPNMWEMYVEGYREADVIICPSKYSADIMRTYGCENTKIIPHGCNIPSNVAEMPKQFTVGFCGSSMPNEGITYLLKAWEKLNLKDCTLSIAAKNINTMLPYIRKYAYGNVQLKSITENITDFYNNISVYVQPSVSVGFSIEVVDALAHGRPVIVSEGDGANECIAENVTGFSFIKRDIDDLAQKIKSLYDNKSSLTVMSAKARTESMKYDWSLIKQQYIALWNRI